MLESQLFIYSAKFKEIEKQNVTLKDVVKFMKKYSGLLSEMSTVLKLLLGLPATNAESECAFIRLKQIETDTYSKYSGYHLRIDKALFM